MSRFADDATAAVTPDHLYLFGEEVTYHFADGSSSAIKAIPDGGELGTRPQGQDRTMGRALEITVSQSDVATVTVNGDEVEFPGEWVGRSGTVRRRVVGMPGGRGHGGGRRLALAAGR